MDVGLLWRGAGSVTPVQVSIAKMTNVRSAIDIGLQVIAPPSAPAAVTLEYPLIRHANNLEAVPTYEGTEEIHLLAIGQALTGISAYRQRLCSDDRAGMSVRFVFWAPPSGAVGR